MLYKFIAEDISLFVKTQAKHCLTAKFVNENETEKLKLQQTGQN